MRRSYFFSLASLVPIVTLYIFVVIMFKSIDPVHLCLVLLIILLGILPALMSLIDPKESVLIPLMPLHGIYYAFTYGLPTFLSTILSGSEDAGPKTKTLLFTVLGLVFLNLGFYVFRGFYSKPSSIQFLRNVSIRRQIWIAWIMCGLYLLFQIFPAFRSLPSVGHLDVMLGYLSMGLLFALLLDKQLNKKHTFLLVLVIIYSTVIKILSGSLAPAFFLLVFLGVIYWSKRKIIPWAFIIAGVFVVVGLNPVKHHYRDIAWENETFSALSSFEKASIFYDAIQVFYERDLFTSLAEDTSTLDRVSRLSTLENVISMTPDDVPYWMGGSYRTLFTSFIPRIIWPGKPEAKIGQEFGHRYSLLHKKDDITSYNLPWLPEFYANFGISGIILGMFLVGALFRFIVQKMSAPINQNPSFILGLAISFYLFYADSNLALMLGGVLLKYLAGLSILWILTANYVWERKVTN